MSTRAAACWAGGIRPEWTLTVAASTDPPPPSPEALAALGDRALVRICLEGRPEAFDALVERYQRAVYRLCRRFAPAHEDALDLSQEVFLRAFKGLDRFRGDAALSTWLYRIAVNVCLNRAAARPPRAVPLDAAAPLAAGEEDAAARLERRGRRDRVRAAIARLPARQRATIILRVYHELPHEEIAAVLGTTVGASKANLFHALRSLKRRLSGDGTEGR